MAFETLPAAPSPPQESRVRTLTIDSPDGPLQRDYSRFNRSLIERHLAWLRIRGFSRKSLVDYTHVLDVLASSLGGTCFLAVQHADLLQHLTGLYERGLGKNSVARHILAIRSLHRFASQIGLPCSPAPGLLRPPKMPQRIGGFHTLDEIERLLAATRTPQERALIEVAFGTGCRISELRGIRVEQIQWGNGDVSSVRVLGKGDRERMVYFGAPAEKALRDLLRDRAYGFVFRHERPQEFKVSERPRVYKRGPYRKPGQTPPLCKARPKKSNPTLHWHADWSDYSNGKTAIRCSGWFGSVRETTHAEAERRLKEKLATAVFLKPQWRKKLSAGKARTRPFADVEALSSDEVREILKTIGRRAGIETHPHKFRHSCATAMLNRGAGLRELQEILGHQHLQTTARYLHSTTAELVAVHRKFHPREQEDGNEQEKV